MSKLPFMQFFPGDWLRDTRKLNPATKGHWIDLLCAMWDSPTRGEINWTLAAYARHLGVSIEMAAQVLFELIDSGTADGEFLNDVDGNCRVDCVSDHRGDVEDVRAGACFGFDTNCQQHVRLVNRRMRHDEQVREKNRKEQQKSREKRRIKEDCQECVRNESPSIYQKSYIRSHISEKKKKKNNPPISPQGGTRVEAEDFVFNRFWKTYPRKVKKAEAYRAWCKEAKLCADIQSAIFAALEWQMQQEDWLKDNGRFVPYPASYLNGRRWEDEPPPARSNGLSPKTVAILTRGL